MKIHVILYLLFCSSLSSQSYFSEVHTVWDDRFDEWEIIGFEEDDEFVIQLNLIWPLQNNWNEWRIQGGDIEGSIKTKWRGDPSQWEIRAGNELVIIVQQYRGDVNRWEVRNGDQRYLLSTVWNNDANNWHTPRNKTAWSMKTEFRDDPRDWIIEDYMIDSVPKITRLALIFIALWQSIPKT